MMMESQAESQSVQEVRGKTTPELKHQGAAGQREEEGGNRMPWMREVGSWRHET